MQSETAVNLQLERPEIQKNLTFCRIFEPPEFREVPLYPNLC